MEITKIATLTSDEVELLKSAGELLGSIVRGLDDGSITELAAVNIDLVKAVYDVAARAHSKTYKGN